MCAPVATPGTAARNATNRTAASRRHAIGVRIDLHRGEARFGYVDFGAIGEAQRGTLMPPD